MQEEPDKLDALFEHISGLYDQLKALKKQPEYTPFEEIQENKYSFTDAEKGIKEEILQYSVLAVELNQKDGIYYLAPQTNKPTPHK